mmetsp:Transcript_44018/g.111429  ORF Transcript_44018/g.111429 Transcript_44018/m.111429 type:complete len:372 (+) Transcript_44018:111-1226(+)
MGGIPNEAPSKIFGNSKVFCGGRLIAGPDGRSCVATWLMVAVPSLAWQFSVGWFFAKRYGGLIPCINGLLLVASLTLLFATAFSDPGIMPRQKDYGECADPVTGALRARQPPRYFDTILRGHAFRLKYCVTCNIYRPPRCTHCSVCENCVERFDHHCPWIGNCVGKRNYWLFYWFVTSTGALNALSLATAAAQIGVLSMEIGPQQGVDTTAAFVEALRQEPLSAALAIYCTLLVWFTVGLCIYHTYLMCTNQTTYEQIKGVYSSGIQNPFNRGFSSNGWDVLCSPVRPRYFDALTGQLRWPPSRAPPPYFAPRPAQASAGASAPSPGRAAPPAATSGAAAVAPLAASPAAPDVTTLGAAPPLDMQERRSEL